MKGDKFLTERVMRLGELIRGSSVVFINANGQVELTPEAKRTSAAVSLAMGRSYRETAASVGVSARQLMNWKKDPEFLRLIQRVGGNYDSE